MATTQKNCISFLTVGSKFIIDGAEHTVDQIENSEYGIWITDTQGNSYNECEFI